MKTIKVAEATELQLDWLVARLEGDDLPKSGGKGLDYSSDWAAGGPIIDREDIFFSPLPDMGLRAFQFKDGQYLNIVDCWPYKEQLTRLVLGMRCYVASKLGDTAEVPEEPT